MDWIQTFVILGVFIGGFFYLAAKIDGVRKDLDEVRKELSKEIKEVRGEIQKNREDILWLTSSPTLRKEIPMFNRSITGSRFHTSSCFIEFGNPILSTGLKSHQSDGIWS